MSDKHIVNRVYSAQDVQQISDELDMPFSLPWLNYIKNEYTPMRPNGKFPFGLQGTTRYRSGSDLYTFTDVCLVLCLRGITNGNSYSTINRHGKSYARKGVGMISMRREHTMQLIRLAKHKIQKRVEFLGNYGSLLHDHKSEIRSICEVCPWNSVNIDTDVLVEKVYNAVTKIEEKRLSGIGI